MIATAVHVVTPYETGVLLRLGRPVVAVGDAAAAVDRITLLGALVRLPPAADASGDRLAPEGHAAG